MNSLANHQAPMQNKQSDDRMKLEPSALQPESHGYLRKRPALVDPVRHNLYVNQAHGNGRALEVL